MNYLFEPQKNISDRTGETEHCPCAMAEAEIVAVFTFEGRAGADTEFEFKGDIPVADFLAFVRQYGF